MAVHLDSVERSPQNDFGNTLNKLLAENVSLIVYRIKALRYRDLYFYGREWAEMQTHDMKNLQS